MKLNKQLIYFFIILILQLNLNAEEFVEVLVSPPNGEKMNESKIELLNLEKTYTIFLESKVNVFIPLEIMTDIDIDATVIGNQMVEVPFDIELNREPEKLNYYTVKYSQNEIDIDSDGKIDTYIFSPKYLNEKITKDNKVKIYGEKITKEGRYEKIIYMTIDVEN